MVLDIEKIAFTVILHAGNAKAEAYKALGEAKKGNFEDVNLFMKNAKDQLNEVHSVQTDLLVAESNGEGLNAPIILIHAQDHLMTAMSEINLIEEFIDFIKEMKRLEQEVTDIKNNIK